MTEPSVEDVDLACQAFLIAMMRESIKRSPDAEQHSVPMWAEMSVTDKGVLRRSMKVALIGVARSQAKATNNSQL